MKQKITNSIFAVLTLVSTWGFFKTGWLRNSPDYRLSFEISLVVLMLMVAIHLILAFKFKNAKEKVTIDFKDEIKNLPKTVFYATAEEIIFRGIVTYLIAYAAGIYYGIIFGTLVFASVHGNKDKFTVIYSLIMGLGLGIGVVYSQDIVFPILTHILFNIFGGIIKTVNKEQKNDIIK